jgi:hypothetical protein
MSEFLDRSRTYQVRIREVLLRDWDPIGVSEIPEAQDEYDHYIHEIHGQLIRHEPLARLIDHLWWIETSHMALFGNRVRTERIARQLVELRDRMEAGG